MVPPCSRAGACSRSEAVGCIVISVSEAREARRSALTRPAVPLNIAARSPLLLLYTSSVFGRKSKLAWLPRAYRTPMMPCCHPTARGLSAAETPRVKAQPSQTPPADHSPASLYCGACIIYSVWRVNNGTSSIATCLFSKADKLTVVIPPSCKSMTLVLRADEQARGTHLRYALVKLFYQMPQNGAPLLHGDAVGFFDGKHHGVPLVDRHLHQR